MADIFESFKGENLNSMLRIDGESKPLADWLWEAWRHNDESLALTCIRLALK